MSIAMNKSNGLIDSEKQSNAMENQEAEDVKMENNEENGSDDSIEAFDDNLPETVSLLRGPNGSKVYVVGTAHFSRESQNDVSKVIKTVKPNIVIVELCKGRASILTMDENTIEEEAKNLSFEKMRSIIKEHGALQGMLNILLINISAQLTRDLGMAPGGEFRRAFEEAKLLQNCMFHFGDRPIKVTLSRALSVLSWWNRIKLMFALMLQSPKVSHEEVERFKQSNLLEAMLDDLTNEYPELGKVFIDERDTYLTYSLQLAATFSPPPQNGPIVAVGIVGIGHKPGIVRLWGKVKEEDIPPILAVEEKKSPSYFKRATILAITLYIGYKISKKVFR